MFGSSTGEENERKQPTILNFSSFLFLGIFEFSNQIFIARIFPICQILL